MTAPEDAAPDGLPIEGYAGRRFAEGGVILPRMGGEPPTAQVDGYPALPRSALREFNPGFLAWLNEAAGE